VRDTPELQPHKRLRSTAPPSRVEITTEDAASRRVPSPLRPSTEERETPRPSEDASLQVEPLSLSGTEEPPSPIVIDSSPDSPRRAAVPSPVALALPRPEPATLVRGAPAPSDAGAARSEPEDVVSGREILAQDGSAGADPTQREAAFPSATVEAGMVFAAPTFSDESGRSPLGLGSGIPSLTTVEAVAGASTSLPQTLPAPDSVPLAFGELGPRGQPTETELGEGWDWMEAEAGEMLRSLSSLVVG